MNHRKFLGLYALLISVFVAGCHGGSDGDPLDPNTHHVPISGGTFNFQNNAFRLTVPANSISAASNITVVPASGVPAEANLINGTAFRMTSSNAATFSGDTRIRITYPTLLGADPTGYRIYEVEGNQWVLLNNQQVLTGSNQVEAQIDGPGTYGILSGLPIGTPTIYKTVLNTGQEVGTVLPPDLGAFGTATVTIPSTDTAMGVRLETTGLSNVVSAHIHRGRLGENGPVAATLYTATMGAFSNNYFKSVTTADLNTAVVTSVDELINLIETNNAYINIHTSANGGGAVRGQLGDNVSLAANLTSAQEVPDSGSTATGTGTVRFNKDMSSFDIMLDGSGFTSNVTMAHIHIGAAGQTGGVLFPLFQGTSTGAFHVMRTLTAADFTAAGGVNTYNEAVAAILSGNTYFNIHTVNNPTGEIRGQILPLPLD